MQTTKDLLEKYYRGETSLEEERELKKAYKNGLLPEDPSLSLQESTNCPDGLQEQIRKEICQRNRKRIRHIASLWTAAAICILVVAIKLLLPSVESEELRLSDNIKRERLEDALRIVGKALEEKNTSPQEKVLYEDDKLIITVQ